PTRAPTPTSCGRWHATSRGGCPTKKYGRTVSRVSPTWDPGLYLDFDDHRSRPFHDLVARVGATAPRRVVDLGCGPGHLTGVIAERWAAVGMGARAQQMGVA